ncbi:hypothetical protein [Streptomyces sp. NBC_00162]|uniref:hypothetical protein n=1 Tax=Streptomyces sp. NBC_00162 TaxID=2903629 RepID=UPI00214BB07F|nr:hypothetical protein [Streptomyces sp. NBC_00162]UUU37731.1 hypothetical protein JIW86_01700 [Streptomyces sp. NBC_00162]
MAHHVTAAFQPGPPGVKGAWADGADAERKFRGFLGTYGSQEGVRIVLWAESDGERERLRTWTKDRGPVIHRKAPPHRAGSTGLVRTGFRKFRL